MNCRLLNDTTVYAANYVDITLSHVVCKILEILLSDTEIF